MLGKQRNKQNPSVFPTVFLLILILYHTQDDSDIYCYHMGGVLSPTSSNSMTPSRCPTTEVNSEALYLEKASDTTG